MHLRVQIRPLTLTLTLAVARTLTLTLTQTGIYTGADTGTDVDTGPDVDRDTDRLAGFAGCMGKPFTAETLLLILAYHDFSTSQWFQIIGEDQAVS